MRIAALTLTRLAVVAISAAGLESAQWQPTVDKAIAYLKTHQDDDGSWSRNRSPGVTGIVADRPAPTGRPRPRIRWSPPRR